MQNNHDYILGFILNEGDNKGKIARLNNSISNIIKQHNYPYHIAKILCEASIAATMIGENIKYGKLTIQIKSESIINLLIADYFDNGKIRGYVNWNDELYSNIDDPSFNDLINQGYLTVTIDQGEGTSLYQGIVELRGSSLKEILNEYFTKSEQIATNFEIVVAKDEISNNWYGSGIMLQKLPGDIDNDNWQKIKLFMSTIKNHELLDFSEDPERLLYRLFHEERISLYPYKNIIHSCICNRNKALNILKSLPDEEIEELKKENSIEVKCSFCSKPEIFNHKDLID